MERAKHQELTRSKYSKQTTMTIQVIKREIRNKNDVREE